MDEQRTPKNDDDIVSAAFTSYRSTANKEFSPPPVTALMARAERARPRKRALTVSVAALACTGLMFAGVAVAQTVAGPGDEDHGPAAKGSGGTKDDDEDQGGGSESDDGQDGGSSQPGDLYATSIALPAWEGLASECPAGNFVFPENGSEVPDGEPGDSGDDPGAWVLLPNGAQPSYTDLDADGDSEAIVQVSCGETPGVIALDQQAEEFNSLGFVYAAQEPGANVQVASVEGANVTLNVADGEASASKARTFTYADGQFGEGEPENPGDDPSVPSDDDPGDGPSGGTPTPDPDNPGDEPSSPGETSPEGPQD